MSNLSLSNLQEIIQKYYYCNCHRFIKKENIRHHLRGHPDINYIMIILGASDLAKQKRDQMVEDIIDDFNNKFE
jgi:hypothetical protein